MIYSEIITYNIYAIILSLGPGLPLILALTCCRPFRKTTKYLLPWAAAPALLTPFIVPQDVVVNVGWFFMGGRMGLDETGQVFLCTSAFIWLLAALGVRDRLVADPKGPRFIAFFLVAMAGNFGLILARDMLGYYLFFALMSLATYGLVAHNNTNDARRAGRIYLLLVIIGEVAMFAGLIILADVAKSIALADIVWASFPPVALILLFISFGVKIGVLPFHVWMPLAYQSIPIPAAAALAGAMINAGLLGWLRFLPLGKAALPEGAKLFIAAGALAAIYGVVLGLGQKKPRAVLAYSSISQMGLMTVIVGFGLMAPDIGQQAVYVLTIYAVHHALAKSSLFLGLYMNVNSAGQISRWRIAGLLLPALALAGLPLTGGAIAKTAFKELAATVGEPWHGCFEVFLPVASIGTTILVLHFIRLLLRSESADILFDTGNRTAWTISLAGVALGLWLLPVAKIYAHHSLFPVKLWQSLWPVMTGSLIVYWLDRIAKNRDTLYAFPAGDILALFARYDVLHWQPFINESTNKVLKMDWLPFRRWLRFALPTPSWPRLRRAEKILERWEVVGLFYLMLCSILLFLLF